MKTAARAGSVVGAWSVCLALGLCACSDDPQLLIVIRHPTLVQVEPVQFQGTVPCLPAEGAMRLYVATLFDVTSDPDAGTSENFALPSSGPTSCTAPVAFAFVVPGHRYAAEIEGYDRADIRPLAAGSRVMVDEASGETVAPRWTTSCAREPDQGVMAFGEITRTMTSCAALTDHEPGSADTQVIVEIEPALGALACGSEPGQVDRFEVTTGSASASGACGESALLESLPAGTITELELLAFEAEQTTPSFGTTCQVKPEAGVVVAATCAPLESDGALSIDLPELLASAALACDGSLRELVIVSGEQTERITPPECARSLSLPDLAPGPTSVQVSTTLADGSLGPTATCSGNVLPGLTAQASCSLD